METSVADNTDAAISKEVEEENTEKNVKEFDAEDFSDLTPEEMSIQSEEQFKEGRQLLADSKFDEAVLILQRALSMRVACFGELDVQCAPYYLAYGESLLKVVQKESGLLGDQGKNPAEPAPKPPVKPQDPSKEEEPKPSTNEDAPADDRQLAWENVEIARVILSKSERPEDQPILAQCHETCGDIFLENDRYGEAANEFLQAAKIHESVSGRGSRRAAGDWVSAAVASVFNNKTQDGYAFYMEALSNLDFRLRNLIGQPLEEEDEEEMVLLDPEVLEQWLKENKEHKDEEEVREIWEFCCEISERLDGFQDLENQQANQEDVAKIVQEMLAQEMQKLAQGAEADDDEPVNDMGIVRKKRPLEDPAAVPPKKQKVEN